MSPPLPSPRGISLPALHFLYGPYLQLTHLSPFGHPVFRKNSFDPAVFLLNLVFSLNDFVCFNSFFTLHSSHNSFWQASSWVLPSLFFFYSCEMYVYCYLWPIVQLIQHKLPEKIYIIYSGLWFLNNSELAVFKREVRASVHVCFIILFGQA